MTDREKLIIASDALTDIDACWCKHVEAIRRMNDQSKMSRNWCCDCGTWVYRNEKNPAREALDKIGERI